MRLARALATTVGLSSLSIAFNLSIKSDASTRCLSWSYSLATQKAAVFRTYGSASRRSCFVGGTVASTNSLTWMYDIVRSANALTNGFESCMSYDKSTKAFNDRSQPTYFFESWKCFQRNIWFHTGIIDQKQEAPITLRQHFDPIDQEPHTSS
jgi:hypothetical protein